MPFALFSSFRSWAASTHKPILYAAHDVTRPCGNPFSCRHTRFQSLGHWHSIYQKKKASSSSLDQDSACITCTLACFSVVLSPAITAPQSLVHLMLHLFTYLCFFPPSFLTKYRAVMITEPEVFHLGVFFSVNSLHPFALTVTLQKDYECKRISVLPSLIRMGTASVLRNNNSSFRRNARTKQSSQGSEPSPGK